MLPTSSPTCSTETCGSSPNMGPVPGSPGYTNPAAFHQLSSPGRLLIAVHFIWHPTLSAASKGAGYLWGGCAVYHGCLGASLIVSGLSSLPMTLTQTRFIVYKVYPRTPLRHFLQPIRIPAETGTGSVDKVLAFKPVDLSSALVSLARVSRESQGGWLLRNNTFMLTCSLCVRTHGHTHTTYMTCTPRVLAWKLEVMRVYQDSPRPQHEGPTFALSGT